MLYLVWYWLKNWAYFCIVLMCVYTCISLLLPLAVHFRLLTEFNIHVHVNIKISNSLCRKGPRENLRAKDICYWGIKSFRDLEIFWTYPCYSIYHSLTDFCIESLWIQNFLNIGKRIQRAPRNRIAVKLIFLLFWYNNKTPYHFLHIPLNFFLIIW